MHHCRYHSTAFQATIPQQCERKSEVVSTSEIQKFSTIKILSNFIKHIKDVTHGFSEGTDEISVCKHFELIKSAGGIPSVVALQIVLNKTI